jgi:hypothetical protein
MNRRIRFQECGWLIYHILLVGVFLIAWFFFSRYDLFHTNLNSARYILSALIQSEATVIAIIITMSLVAVQLSASSYSSRTLEIFRKNPDFWILIVIYLLAIICSSIVLKLLVDEGTDFMVGIYIDFSLFLGIFCFVALIPYLYRIFALLKPSNIIKTLSERINRENIIKKSIDRSDPETTSKGLKLMTSRICSLFEDKFTEHEERLLSDRLFKIHLSGIWAFVLERKDQYSGELALQSITLLGMTAKIEGGLDLVVKDSIQLLGLIGENAVMYNLDLIARKAISDLWLFGFRATGTVYRSLIMEKIENIIGQAIGSNWNEIVDKGRMAYESLQKNDIKIYLPVARQEMHFAKFDIMMNSEDWKKPREHLNT